MAVSPPLRRPTVVFCGVAAAEGSAPDPRYDYRTHDHRMVDNGSTNLGYRDSGMDYRQDHHYSNGQHHATDRSSLPAGRGIGDSGHGVGSRGSMQGPWDRSGGGYDGQWRGDESRNAPAIGLEREGLRLGGFSPMERCWLLVDKARKTNLPAVGGVLLLFPFLGFL